MPEGIPPFVSESTISKIIPMGYFDIDQKKVAWSGIYYKVSGLKADLDGPGGGFGGFFI